MYLIVIAAVEDVLTFIVKRLNGTDEDIVVLHHGHVKVVTHAVGAQLDTVIGTSSKHDSVIHGAPIHPTNLIIVGVLYQ